MKRLFILLTAGWLLYPITNYSSETAHARLYCMSLQFQEGTTYGGTLDISSISSPLNGELYPASDGTWASGLVLDWSQMEDGGWIDVNLPPFVDANSNGFNDFFEVAQGVTNEVTSGTYATTYYGDFSGTVTATWNRTAGSASGSCALYLYDDLWGGLGTFTCTFTLIEYTGPLTYTPGTNIVSAAVNLVQTGNSSSTLQGPIVFDKSPSDPTNTLANESGDWTNAASQTLSFDSEIFSRDPRWPTNYAGYVYFYDGDPSTASQDYQLWVLSIDDTNDANANGIPDFSDNPGAVAPPRAPWLSLALGTTNLLLKISGDVSHTNQIQEIGSLASTNWLTTLSFLQATNPQTVSLPLPAHAPKFWRVVAW